MEQMLYNYEPVKKPKYLDPIDMTIDDLSPIFDDIVIPDIL